MCSRNCCLVLCLYQYHRPTAYREGVSLGFVLCLYSDDCFPQMCFFYICLPLFHLLTDRGAETQGGRGWGDIPPIIWLYPPNSLRIVCIFKLLGGFWCSLNLLSWKKSWSRFIPPKLKMGQNWRKIASYPPQCSTKIGTPAHPTSQTFPSLAYQNQNLFVGVKKKKHVKPIKTKFLVAKIADSRMLRILKK